MGEDVAGCAHEWRLVRAVLDEKGALRVFRCERCGAEAVQPAAGDVGGWTLPGWESDGG